MDEVQNQIPADVRGEPETRRLQGLRILVGLTILISFCSLLFHFPTLREIRVAGIDLAPLDSAFWQSSFVDYFLGLLAIFLTLMFIAGRFLRIVGVLLLGVHAILHPVMVYFSWEPLFDLYLCTLLLMEWMVISPKNAIRLARTIAIVGITWISWSQLPSAPWINGEMLARYLAHAPVGGIFAMPSGLMPLMLFAGGIAWQLQLTFIFGLFFRVARGYFAAALALASALVCLLIPTAFFYGLACASAFLFLPDEWLKFDFADWREQGVRLRSAARGPALVLIICVMIATIFHRNYVDQFQVLSRFKGTVVDKSYRIISSPYVAAGNLILFNSIWKMYTPVWKHVVWIDWYATDKEGRTTLIPQENFSPEYRVNRRTWMEALWSDFKKEKVFVGMLSGEHEQEVYAKYLCHELSAGRERPVSVHAEISSFEIRPPEDDWELSQQVAERVDKKREISCDSENAQL